jgi:hypothetical protein
MASEQEFQALLNVYQRKVSDLTSQTIALEARVMVLSSQLNSLQQGTTVPDEQPQKTGRRVNTKKSNMDSGEF